MLDNSINFNIVEIEINFLIKKLISNIKLYKYYHKKTLPPHTRNKLIKKNGDIYETNGSNESIVYFREVDDKIGRTIQDKFHYINSYRNDTKYQFGFFRRNAEIPFVYVSFSVLDRNYLKSIPYLQAFSNSKILVKTRSFGFENCPQNAMSLLYSVSSNYFRKNNEFSIILTAVNQNLLFHAKSFLGASYFPIATSPLTFQYLDGLYVTRRKIKKAFGTDDINILVKNPRYQISRIAPLPIVWLIKGIKKYERKKIELDYIKNMLPIYKISKQEYSKK